MWDFAASQVESASTLKPRVHDPCKLRCLRVMGTDFPVSRLQTCLSPCDDVLVSMKIYSD